MQKSKIKVGEAYIVDIDGLVWPSDDTKHEDGRLSKGSRGISPHAYTSRGVSKHYTKRVSAKVVAMGQPRPFRPSGRYSSSDLRTAQDGVVIEFDVPLLHGPVSKLTIERTAVLDSRHIIMSVADYHQRQVEAEMNERRWRAEADQRATEFEPTLTRVMLRMRALGFKNVTLSANNWVVFNGGKLQLNLAECSDGVFRPTGFAYGSVLMTDAFVAWLLGTE